MNGNTINDDVTFGGAPGALLAGRYRVVRQLGQGGMGSVWLAEDVQLDDRQVALKMLPSVLVSNKRAYNQLKAEALVSLKLTHPNIATVRAFEENGGNPFLVVDYIDGQTLDDYLVERGWLSEEEAVRLLKPVAAALDYAHAEGVVHRDVKPGNVIIRRDGHPFVLDFGIAREIQETMTRVTGKLSSGTLLYMSPEQLNGAAPKASQDVYSFAAMTYECLTGAPPFRRGQIEYQIQERMPEPLADEISIGAAVMRGLAKTPVVRPATCSEVVSTFRRQRPAGRAAADVARHRKPSETGPKGWRLLPPLLCILISVVVMLAWKWHKTADANHFPPVLIVTNGVEVVTTDVPVVTNSVVVVTKDVPVVTNRVVVVTKDGGDPPPPSAGSNDVQKVYVEIERLAAEVSIAKSYAEQVIGQLNEYERDQEKLDLVDDFVTIDTLKSVFDTNVSAMTDLAAASNAWRKVSEARSELSKFVDKFRMARLAYEQRQVERTAAEKARDTLNGMDVALKECEADRLAPREFETAAQKRKSGEGQLSAGQYVLARTSFSDAASWAEKALQSARACKVEAALAAAEAFLRSRQWQKALEKAEEALCWQKDNEMAIRVRRAAVSRLTPKVREVCCEHEFVPCVSVGPDRIRYLKDVKVEEAKGAVTVAVVDNVHGAKSVVVSSKVPRSEIVFLTIVAEGRRKTVSCQLKSKGRKTQLVDVSE